MFGWLKKRRRKKILAQPWPSDWSTWLNENVRISRRISKQEMSKLQQCVKIFIAEKTWEGIDGLEIDDEIRVTVAAQACLMLLGTEDFYFEKVITLILFPHPFERQAQHGLTIGGVEIRAGEAWQGGPVALAWSEVLQGGRNPSDGHNVVIHEFAHVVDGLDGEMGGDLWFDSPELAEEWSEVLKREFHALRQAKEKGIPTVLDDYGATNEAEFFAVATETFFEKPHPLSRKHPQLFRLLKAFYNIDPSQWQIPRSERVSP